MVIFVSAKDTVMVKIYYTCPLLTERVKMNRTIKKKRRKKKWKKSQTLSPKPYKDKYGQNTYLETLAKENANLSN